MPPSTTPPVDLGPIPGGNLPRMPCIPPLTRRKRQAGYGETTAQPTVSNDDPFLGPGLKVRAEGVARDIEACAGASMGT